VAATGAPAAEMGDGVERARRERGGRLFVRAGGEAGGRAEESSERVWGERVYSDQVTKPE
jgi:hypothetical protein